MNRNTVGYTESKTYRCLEDLEKAFIIGSGSPLRLCYCGIEDCEPGWRFGPYVRENYVIHIVTGGRGTYRAGGSEYDLGKGCMFIIFPGDETVYCADEEDPWSYMWIGFNGREAANVIRQIGFSKDNPVVIVENIPEIKEAIERMLDARKLNLSDALKRSAPFYDVPALMLEQRLDDNASYDGICKQGGRHHFDCLS